MYVYKLLLETVPQESQVLVEEPEVESPPVVRDHHRQGRTLGLATLGVKALGEGVKLLGSATAGAIGTTIAAKPLVILGLGKCKEKTRKELGAGFGIKTGME